MNKLKSTNHRRIRAVGAGLALLLSMSGMSACGGDSSGESKDTVSLTYISTTPISPTRTLELSAIEGGKFGAEGLKVKFVPANGTSQAVNLVSAGKGDFGAGSPFAVVAANHNGADLVAFGIRNKKFPFYLVTPADKPIDSAAVLKGKKVGINSVGGDTDQGLDAVLGLGGFGPKAVKRQVVPPTPAAYESVKNGTLDAVILNTSGRAHV